MATIEGLVCLVTGGASGIGKATVSALLEEGAYVHVADLSPDALGALARQCKPAQRLRLDCQLIDVTDRGCVESWVTAVFEQRCRIDVLVHCAVRTDWTVVEHQPVEAIGRTMHVGFEGMVHCTKAVLPIMRLRRFGRIVNVGSVASTMHLFPGYAAYAALKAATDAWTQMLQIELHGSSIQIANVRPGIVTRTDLFKHAVDRSNLPRIFDLLPAVTPEKVAKTILKAIENSNTTYVVPRSYRVLELLARWFPRLSRWLCSFGVSRRGDIQTRDDETS